MSEGGEWISPRIVGRQLDAFADLDAAFRQAIIESMRRIVSDEISLDVNAGMCLIIKGTFSNIIVAIYIRSGDAFEEVI